MAKVFAPRRITPVVSKRLIETAVGRKSDPLARIIADDGNHPIGSRASNVSPI